MKKFALFLSALVLLFSCQKSENVENNSNSNTSNSTGNTEIIESFENGFYHLQGKLNNKYPMTMNIFVQDNKIVGSMYYDKAGKYIMLEGEIDNSGNVTIKGTAPNNKISDIFDGTFANKTFSGTWSSEVTDNTYQFSLKQTDKNYVLCDSVAYEYKDSIDLGERYAYFDGALDDEYPIAYPVPEAGKKIDKEIRTLLDEINKTKENIIAKEKEWREFVMESIDYSEDIPSGMEDSYEIIRSFRVTMDSHGILTVRKYKYDYEGGAHGYTTLEYHSYDLMTGNEYTYEDIFSISKKDLLKKVIIKKLIDYFKEEYGEQTENIGFSAENIGFPDAFYIDEKGIGIYYAEYSFGSYGYGYTEFIIEYKDLTNYLTENFKKKMKL